MSKPIMLERILQLIGDRHGAAKELTEALGVRPNAVTEWKAGRNKSYPKYAPQIAAYYGVSLDWLSGVTDEKEQKNSPTLEEDEASVLRREIRAQLDGMTVEQLERFKSVIALIVGS